MPVEPSGKPGREHSATSFSESPFRGEFHGVENVMFEAADPAVFNWYAKSYGPDVNLFVDHSQIVQLECLRSGLWGTADTWGRILTYDPEP